MTQVKTHRGKKSRWVATATAVAAMTLGTTAFAKRAIDPVIDNIIGNEGVSTRPLVLLISLAVLAMVPFVLIMVTSFVKIAVVLSIVRQAIGTQQIPPTQVITGMAIVMTIYIMMPVGLRIYHETQDQVISMGIKEFNVSTMKASDIITIGGVAEKPLRDFLIRHAHLKDRDMFYKIAWRMREPRDRASLTDEDYSIIVPAFVISELKEAFQIGFILFVPFLVVDLVVANILMALGMQMLSPTTISLPFKVLLFVLVDGWYLISRGLVLGYQ